MRVQAWRKIKSKAIHTRVEDAKRRENKKKLQNRKA